MVDDRGPLVGDEQHEVAGLGARASSTMPSCSASDRNLATGESSVAAVARPASTPGPWRPSCLARSVSSSSRPRRRRRPRPGTRMPFTHGAWKARNSVAANTSRELDQLQAEAHVGLVGAVALLRLVPRHARDRRRAASPVTASAAASTASAMNADARRPGVGEAHLGVELHELELAVGAQVLVAQAAGDLVVAVEAADHAAAA